MNGALTLVPGSHRWGMLDGKRDADSNMQAYGQVPPPLTHTNTHTRTRTHTPTAHHHTPTPAALPFQISSPAFTRRVVSSECRLWIII